MIEQWYCLKLEPGPRPALILDASESAKAYWPVFRSLVEGILEALPDQTSWPRIFFLGNPQPYDASAFAARGDTWFQQNVGRGSFISPIFERLESEPETAVVVVGAGRLFDLADWKGHPLGDRAVWSFFGPVGITDGHYPEESLASEQLAERLNNPSLRVEVGAPGVMPYFWDDPGFRFEDRILVGRKTTGTIRIGVLAPDHDMLRAYVVQANNARRALLLEPTEAVSPAPWQKLPLGEYNQLRQALRQDRYRREPLTLPTLDALPRGTFCKLDTYGFEAKIQPVPCAALKINDEAVAVRQGEAAQIYRFDPQSGEWQMAETFTAKLNLEDKIDALVL